MEHGANANILVVDDANDNRLLLKAILEKHHYNILCCNGGLSALAEINQFRPDLILLDVIMDDMDGFETCQKIKQIADFRDTPIMFVTAAHERSDITKGFKTGAVDYITKPINPSEVIARVNCHLSLSRQTRHLQELVNNFETILTRISVPIFTLNRQGKFTFINPAGEQIIGYAHDELTHHRFFDFLSPQYRDKLEQAFSHYPKKLDDDDYTIPHETDWHLPNGEMSTLEISICPVILDQVYFVVSVHDITAHKNRESALELQARIDPLTTLPNRRVLEEFLLNERRLQSKQPRPIALMFCDIDHFKKYNDHYGHLGGDDVLVKVAEALKQSVRQEYDLVVRFGGEEFVILISGIPETALLSTAQTIISNIKRLCIPHIPSPTAPYVTASVGAIWTKQLNGYNDEMLLKYADQALYQAKENGRNQAITHSI